jgi:tetratricopeptide (TPR) repeat protein
MSEPASTASAATTKQPSSSALPALPAMLAQAKGNERVSQAKACYERGSLNQALEHLEAALQDDGYNASALLWRAYIMMGRSDFKRAIDDLNGILAFQPTFPGALRMRARCRMELAWAGDRSYVEPAFRDAERVLQDKPDDPEARTVRGAIAVIRHEHDKAIADLTPVIESQTEDMGSVRSYARFCRAFALTRKGSDEHALRDLTVGIREQPNNTAARLSRSRLLAKQARYKEAIDDLDNILAAFPNSPGALCGRARCAVALAAEGDGSQLDAALRDAERLVESEPNNIDARIVRGVVAINRKDTASAIADLSFVIERQPDDSDGNRSYAHYWRGIAFADQRDYRRAIDDFNEAAQRYKPAQTGATILLYRGVCYATIDEFERAIADFSLLIKQHPDNATAYCWRGALYFWNEDMERSLADLDQAVRLRPNYDYVIAYRSYVRWWKGDAAGAKSDMDRLKNIESSDGDAYSVRVFLNMALLHDRDRALRDLDRAIVLEPRSAIHYLVRSCLRAQNKQFVAALNDLAHFVGTQHESALKFACRDEPNGWLPAIGIGYGLKDDRGGSLSLILDWSVLTGRIGLNVGNIGAPSFDCRFAKQPARK